MKNTSSKNLLFLIRHGERADHAGLTPKFHPYDAELTELGKSQATQIGEKIQLYLQKNYPQKISKIKLISSPFARTIQTSKKILNELKKNEFNIDDIIEIDYFFSECRKTKDFKDPDFISFIILLNKLDLLTRDLEATKVEFRNKPEGIVEKLYEDIEDCFKRVKAGLEKMYEKEFKVFDEFKNINKKEHNKNENEKENKEIVNVILIVSHGEPITQLNRLLEYPEKLDSDLVKYCDSFCYDIEHCENQEFKTKYLEKLSLFDQKETL